MPFLHILELPSDVVRSKPQIWPNPQYFDVIMFLRNPIQDDAKVWRLSQHNMRSKSWNHIKEHYLKSTSGRKKSYAQMKEREKCKKKRAITDLNAPNGSRDIPFQSQEFGQDGYRHFVGCQPHFQLNMTSQTQYCKTMKKWNCNISGVFFLICLKLCRLLELGNGILTHFKFCCYGNQNQNYCLLLKKQKVYCLSKSDV